MGVPNWTPIGYHNLSQCMRVDSGVQGAFSPRRYISRTAGNRRLTFMITRKKMMKRILLASALLGIGALPAMAETPTFDFVQVGYITDLSGSSDYDGFDVKGNLEITDAFYMNAGFTRTNGRSSIFDVDLDVLTLGLGYKSNISDVSTIFAELDYLNLDSNFNGFDSDNGFQVGFGIRSKAIGSVELKAVGYYRDAQSSDAFVQVGAVYDFTEVAGVYLDIETDFDDTGLNLGLRFSF